MGWGALLLLCVCRTTRLLVCDALMELLYSLGLTNRRVSTTRRTRCTQKLFLSGRKPPWVRNIRILQSGVQKQGELDGDYGESAAALLYHSSFLAKSQRGKIDYADSLFRGIG